MLEELVPLVAVGGLWIMVIAVVAIGVWGGVVRRRETNETLRRAIEAGHKLDPDTLSALERPARSAEDDLRSGITLTALAAGLAACFALYAAGAAPGGMEAGFGFAIAGILVGAIGVGRLLAGLARRAPKHDREA